ncbi:YraN family protein, partial [Gammaproteobacteria bacterium]|nr:YraN family protein [Gammaproteobacteria bacterium]
RVAELWLFAHGLRTELRNHRIGHDELDLVMRDRGTLVVVEVRYRRNTSHGGAIMSVSASKQQRIIRASQRLHANRPQWQQMPWRFDLVCIDGRPNLLPKIRWLRGAFDAS